MSSNTQQSNSRGIVYSTVDSILRATKKISQSVSSVLPTSASAPSLAVPSTNTVLNTLFYFLLASFILFIILVVIHLSIYPVFRFTPDDKGFIPIPSIQDDKVYWNKGKQPAPESFAPLPEDSIATYPFENNFSFSIDLFVRNFTQKSQQNRIILYKTFPYSSSGINPFTENPIGNSDLPTYMSDYSSMIMYLTGENDLVVTFFTTNSQGNTIRISSKPIQNIPLNTPFRVSVVVEEKLFTVYLNGKETFQQITNEKIMSKTPTNTSSFNMERQRNIFYTIPLWAFVDKQTIFVQNFHLWPRNISYLEVLNASPALASESDFNLPAESDSGTCS